MVRIAHIGILMEILGEYILLLTVQLCCGFGPATLISLDVMDLIFDRKSPPGSTVSKTIRF